MEYSFRDWLRVHESEIRDAGIVVSFLILACIAKKLDIPININLNGEMQSNTRTHCDVVKEPIYFERDSQTNKICSNKAAEEAIELILKGIDNRSWDSEKIKAAKDICEIANGNKSDENVCYKAVVALGELKSRADWSSTREAITSFIKKLAID